MSKTWAARTAITLIISILLVTTSGFAVFRPDIEFDGRDWVLGYKATLQGMEIEEYVLLGANVWNWCELVTWQFFPGWQEEIGAKELMRQFRPRVMLRAPSVQWEVLGSDMGSVLYMWTIEDDPLVESYFEVVRIIEGREGIHTFRYAARNGETFRNNRDAWIASFEEIEVSD